VSAPTAVARTAGVLGHELRNPLAAAVTGNALLRELLDADDPRRAIADGVDADLQRLVRLLDGYLAWFRGGAPAQQPVALLPLCDAVAARRAGLAVDVPPDAVVLGDAALLERVLENLVENALHAGARSVRVSARSGGRGVQLLVDDDGPGVPPELRARIFEPGFSRCGSTGLGLGIVADVLAAHGGSVRCEPRTGGARFVVRLPAATLAQTA
jgi:signal transduction histidine kinase